MQRLKQSLFFALFILVIGVVSASAQLAYGSGIHFTMDEAFTINGRSFSAGKYVISRSLATSNSPSVMMIRGEGTGAIFDTDYARASQASNDTALIFNNLDGTNILTGIRIKGEVVGNQLKMTSRQKVLIARYRPVERVVITDTSGM